MACDFRLREFRFPADYDAVRRLWEGVEKGIRLGISDEPSEIEKKLGRDPDLFLLAETDTEIIGSVIGGFDGRRGLIYHLAVCASFRGQGVGSRLMTEVENRLRARGCRKCYLLVTLDNPEAMAYYDRRDWSPMEHVRLYGKELT